VPPGGAAVNADRWGEKKASSMEFVPLVALWVGWCACIIALAVVTHLPPDPRTRIRAKTSTPTRLWPHLYLWPSTRTTIRAKTSTPTAPLVFPDMCVITGEPATEAHVVRVFHTQGLFVGLARQQILVPFSLSGWQEYCRQFPLSVRIFKAGLNALFWIPIPGLGAFLAIYLWSWAGGGACGILAFRDLWLRKRQVVKFRRIRFRHGGLCEVDMDVQSDSFARELIRLNAGAMSH
jgi:hypothetical protein